MGSTVSQIGTIIGTAIIVGAVTITGGTIAIAWGSVAIGSAVVAGSMALAPKPRLRDGSLQQQAYQQQIANRSLMIKQPVISRSMEQPKSLVVFYLWTLVIIIKDYTS